jgi:hypothetical protein
MFTDIDEVISTISGEVMHINDSTIDEDSEYTFNFEEGRSQKEFEADEAFDDVLLEAGETEGEAFYDDRAQKNSSPDDETTSQKVGPGERLFSTQKVNVKNSENSKKRLKSSQKFIESINDHRSTIRILLLCILDFLKITII